MTISHRALTRLNKLCHLSQKIELERELKRIKRNKFLLHMAAVSTIVIIVLQVV